jgi:gamma-glutamyltranspeptidase / glutathione hydrolase
LALAAFGGLACARDTAPPKMPAMADAPAATRAALEKARPVTAKHAMVVSAQHSNAVAVTYTINFLFGNKQIACDTGFFLNDEMDDSPPSPAYPTARAWCRA